MTLKPKGRVYVGKEMMDIYVNTAAGDFTECLILNSVAPPLPCLLSVFLTVLLLSTAG